MRKFRPAGIWASCSLSVLLLSSVLFALAAPVTTQPAATTAPATQAVGPKRYRYLLTSHADWWVTDQLAAALPRRPFEGVLLMGFHGWGSSGGSPITVLEQAQRLRKLGYEVIPGALVFDGGSAADWTNQRTWQWVALFMLATANEGETFAIDFEPYYKGGTYSDSADLSKAVEPLIEVAKARRNKLLLIPGTRAVFKSGSSIGRQSYLVAAILRSRLPGQVINGDESMYSVTGRPTGWEALLAAAAGDSRVSGEQYMPGFRLPGLSDPTLQAHVQAQGWNSWYYATADDWMVWWKEFGK